MQEVFDRLYADSKNGNNFYKLYEIITSKQNIRLAYRNIKTNSGSTTAGVDGKKRYMMIYWKYRQMN